MTHHTHALSFGTAAEAYDRFRPGYPPDAVEWAAGGLLPRRVVDLAAGTGILTRALIKLGYDVVPVEPDAGMRARLAATTPGVAALAGTAEAIPLPDGSADAVVAGQAYHWFDRGRAHAEVARVLRPGGVFAPLWNIRDDSEPWVAALSRIADTARGPGGTPDTAPDLQSFGELFEPLERTEFRHATRHTADSLLGMMSTRSYYLTASQQDQEQLRQEVRDLVTNHPALAGREVFDLPYRTIVYRARRRP